VQLIEQKKKEYASRDHHTPSNAVLFTKEVELKINLGDVGEGG